MCLKTSFMNAEVRFEPLSERISAGKERQQKIFRRVQQLTCMSCSLMARHLDTVLIGPGRSKYTCVNVWMEVVLQLGHGNPVERFRKCRHQLHRSCHADHGRRLLAPLAASTHGLDVS